MEPTLQLHTNIKEHQKKNRYTNNHVDKFLGLADGTFNTKMTRLKAGSKTSITVWDIGGLMKMFNCTSAALFKDVDFKIGG